MVRKVRRERKNDSRFSLREIVLQGKEGGWGIGTEHLTRMTRQCFAFMGCQRVDADRGMTKKKGRVTIMKGGLKFTCPQVVGSTGTFTRKT